ncbi:putative class V chitinase [Venturia nashicola]|nr:putative class V chitinase [Venturia nashicola]
MKLSSILTLMSAGLAAAVSCEKRHKTVGRNVMYYDQYHTNLTALTPEIASGITHVILAFIPSANFTVTNTSAFTPFESVAKARTRFDKSTKILIAIGGWGDTEGFSAGAKTPESRALFARNVKKMLIETGANGADVDWEYPGGNGANYKTNPNSNKTDEITTYPLLLSEIRAAIGPDYLLTAAVPGLARDMIAYTAATGPSIWKSLDFVNLMSYDLMNRRDTVMKHHTDIAGSIQSVDLYTAIGLAPSKINLGIAFYAKWFAAAANGTCDAAYPIGCKTAVLEDPVTGEDTGLSGAVTFEASNYAIVDETKLANSTDGSCGANVGLTGARCPTGNCCSQYGFCGTTPTFCSLSCQASYGTCSGATYGESFHKAMAPGASKTDTKLGGEYYYDAEAKIFWTWDTAPLIARKFKEIVKPKGLGGVMAWSLAEDAYDWSRVKAMKEGVKKYF